MALEFGEKQVATTIVLTTLTVTAGFTASGVTRLMAGSLLPLEGTASSAAAGGEGGGKAEPAPGAAPPDIKSILQRNMFDPETGALWPPKGPALPEPTEGDEEPVVELAPGAMPPACEGKLKLVASVYAPKRPDWSFVALNTGTGDPMLYRLGSTVDGKLVDSIYPKAVFLKAGAGLCSLTMFAPDAPKGAKGATASSTPATAAATTSTPKVGGSGVAADELDKNIEKVSDTKFNVRRELVDKLLSNQAELMRAARVVPHEQNGQVVGVKLYGIRRKSLLGKLGLQNGDLLRTVNGFDMASPDSALQAYSKLRDAASLSVAVTRRGRAMNIDYNVSK